MAQLSNTMQVLFISLALTTVVSVRVDDEQPQQEAAAPQQASAEQLVAAAQEQAAAVQVPEGDVQQEALALSQEGAALAHTVAYGGAGAAYGAAGVEYGYHHAGGPIAGSLEYQAMYGSHQPIVPGMPGTGLPGMPSYATYGDHHAGGPIAGSLDYQAIYGSTQPTVPGAHDHLMPSYADYRDHAALTGSLTRSAGALRNTQLAMHEAQAARAYAHTLAAHQIHGAQYQSNMASDMANHMAMNNEHHVMTHASTQIIAQRHAQDVALAHSLEAAQAHSRMVQSQEAEKIHAQEAKLAHAEAVTEKRAIEVHSQAEKQIKDIEMLRANGIHELNVRADEEVATSHGEALSGIDGITVKGTADIVQIRKETPAMHEKINAEVQSDATRYHASTEGDKQVGVLGFAHTHPDPITVEDLGGYATKGLGAPMQDAQYPGYPGAMGYGGPEYMVNAANAEAQARGMAAPYVS